MSAGDLQRVRVRERETKAGGEEARSKAWLKTEENKEEEKIDALVLDGRREESEKRKHGRRAN